MAWNLNTASRSSRPDHDCEVFIVGEVIDPFGGLEAHALIMQTDCYNVQEDQFSEDRLKVLYWQEIDFPAAPLPGVATVIRTFSTL